MKRNLSKNEKGFTLVETLFAVFILVMAITGPMTAAQSSLKAAFLARDQITAFYLAQDAIEAVKNLRDSNYINNIKNNGNNDWLSQVNLNGCLNRGLNKECEIDTSNFPNISTRPNCNGASECLLYLDSNNRFTYQSGNGIPTKYTRKVYLNKIDNDELSIRVEVSWATNFLPFTRKIVVQENIYNWLKFN